MAIHTNPKTMAHNGHPLESITLPQVSITFLAPYGTTYAEAASAIDAMKGSNAINLIYDERLMALLMEFPPSIVCLIRKKYKASVRGYPTIDSIYSLLEDLENEGCLGPDTDSFA